MPDGVHARHITTHVFAHRSHGCGKHERNEEQKAEDEDQSKRENAGLDEAFDATARLLFHLPNLI